RAAVVPEVADLHADLGLPAAESVRRREERLRELERRHPGRAQVNPIEHVELDLIGAPRARARIAGRRLRDGVHHLGAVLGEVPEGIHGLDVVARLRVVDLAALGRLVRCDQTDKLVVARLALDAYDGAFFVRDATNRLVP